MSGSPDELCHACRAPLAADQRYCLECGTRHGAPRVDWEALLAPAMTGAEAAPEPAGAGVAAATGPTFGLPSPRVGAALVLTTLAFGVVVGGSAGPGADVAGAGGRPNLTILAQAPPAPAPAPAPTAPPAQPPAVTDTPPAPTTDSSPAASTPAASPAPTASSPTDTSGTGTSGTDTSGTGTGTGTTDTPAAAPAKVPPVKHVWLVVLHGRSYDQTFGDTANSPYLATQLRAKGTLLPWYHATSHDAGAGGVALISGQRNAAGPFPASVQTLPDQLTGAGRVWKAYLEDVAPGQSGCGQQPDAAPQNPFVRFASITSAAECGPSLVGLDRLAPDLADKDSAPAFSYISLPGELGGDDRLHETLDPILASPAYADGGLVVVTFDEGRPDDTEAGGGRVGALLLSPFVAPGGTVSAPYDHFSLLRSVDDLFSLDPLGYAKDTKLKAFGPKVYGAWAPNAGQTP